VTNTINESAVPLSTETTSQSIIVSSSILGIILLACVLLWLSTQIRFLPVKIGLMSFSALLIFFSIGVTLKVFQDYALFPTTLVSIFTQYYILMTALIIGLSFAALLWVLVFILNLWNNMRNLKIG